MRREASKEACRLPHRLVEKKRRDRINECLAQLSDWLPQHLQLAALGHLEKVVILELTLKRLKALTAITEQQHQKIMALQKGEWSLTAPLQSDLEAFHSGFQMCTKEVLQYLSRCESWLPREQQCAQLIGHLHTVCTRFLPNPQLCATSSASPGQQERAGPEPESQPNCMPVTQWTRHGGHRAPSRQELGENDTDTGCGGEGEGRLEGEQSHGAVEWEPSGARQPPWPRG